MSEHNGIHIARIEDSPPAKTSTTNAASNGELVVVKDKMEQTLKLLTELADHVSQIAPEHKHTFEDAKAAINEFGMLLLHGHSTNGGVTRIVAPMPGVVMRCEKKPGEQVKKGDVVLILDAMKVENPIMVPVGGKLISVRYREGQRVAKGAVLAVVNH